MSQGVEGRCFCGAVHYTASYAPTNINDCQCTHCQKRGVMWAYYSPRDVVVTGETTSFAWGPKRTIFHFCTVCGCTTRWTASDPKRDRMGLNTRLLPPEAVAGAVVTQSPGPK